MNWKKAAELLLIFLMACFLIGVASVFWATLAMGWFFTLMARLGLLPLFTD